MQPRKKFIQYIAERYGFDFYEINNSWNFDLGLVSSEVDRPDVFHELLVGISGISTTTRSHKELYQMQSSGGAISETQSELILKKMDKRFHPRELKESKNEAPQSSIMFDEYKVNLNDSYFIKTFIYPEIRLEASEDQYGLILNFKSSEHVNHFLNGIEEKDQRAANSGLFAIHSSYNETEKCHRILISRGFQYQAIALLLGKNRYLNELPIVNYLVEAVNPKNISMFTSMFTSSIDAPITDAQFSAGISVIQKIFQKPSDIALTDFDVMTQAILKSNSKLNAAFLATLKYFGTCTEILKEYLPQGVPNIVNSYRI